MIGFWIVVFLVVYGVPIFLFERRQVDHSPYNLESMLADSGYTTSFFSVGTNR